MAKIDRRKAPSRIRYEQAHPIVSCRVPLDVYNRLEAAKKGGKSFAYILKVGMGIIEAGFRQKEEFIKMSHEMGREKGYAEAEGLFKVEYPCSVCGKTISITTDSAKKAASEYMQEHRWGHSECDVNKQ